MHFQADVEKLVAPPPHLTQSNPTHTNPSTLKLFHSDVQLLSNTCSQQVWSIVDVVTFKLNPTKNKISGNIPLTTLGMMNRNFYFQFKLDLVVAQWRRCDSWHAAVTYNVFVNYMLI